MSNVIVVLGTELGWDCVVGVFADVEAIRESWLFEEEESGRGPEGILNLKKALKRMDMHMFDQVIETATIK